MQNIVHKKISNILIFTLFFLGLFNVPDLNQAQAATITFIQLKEANTAVTSTTASTGAFTNPVSSGNLIAVWIWYNSSTQSVSSVADTQSNTYSRAVGPTTGVGGMTGWRQELWYAKNVTGGSGLNVTATFTGSFATTKGITAHEYSGLDAVAPLDQSVGNTTTSANSTTSAITTTSSDELIFAAATVVNTGSAGTNFTQRSSVASNVSEDRVVTSAGSYTASITNNTQDVIIQMATFKASGSGTPPPPPPPLPSPTPTPVPPPQPPPPPPPGTYPWSNIIAPTRAMDWSKAGVEGGIPTNYLNCTTAACNTLFGGSVSTATINSAIASCGTNQVVRIPAGTFTVSGVTFHQNNCILRGAGADQTKLIFTSGVGGCNYFVDGAISMCTGAWFYGDDGTGTLSADHNTTWAPVGASGNWIAGVGTSQLTFASTTGLAVGTPVVLDQINDPSDGYPATGDLIVCATGAAYCSSQGGGGNAGRSNRAQSILVKVTAINGTTVTIEPPLFLPNWRSSQAPGAWWDNAGAFLHDSGVEDLTIDFTSIGASIAGIAMHSTINTWIKGVRMITQYNSTSGNDIYFVQMINNLHNTVRDSYFYGPNAIGNQRYGITMLMDTSNLVENNIFHHVVGGVIPNGPVIGNVIGYNFEIGALYATGGTVLHGLTMTNLHEGNNFSSVRGDIIHAPHFFETLFRNYLDRAANNPSVNVSTPGDLETNSRFWNFVGNVLGDGSSTTYETVQAQCGACIYELGWGGNNSGAAIPNDANVKRTLLRWGNWDSATNSTRFVASEVPSTIANYSNPLPVSQSLPASFYLPTKPSWFGSVPFPPVGPDVSGGNITNAPTGGHAYKIPSRVCYENAVNDPAYSTSNPRIKLFSASTCYAFASTPTPIVGDINLDHIVNSIDYSILNSHWFTNDASSDLNHDGLVNAIDYSILNANWFKTW
jgi:hypothetical protein